MPRNTVGLHSDGHPFDVFVDGTCRGATTAHDEDHAIQRWLEQEGYDDLDEAAREHGVDPDEIVAVVRRR
jgi:hypothetical protein